ncbi:MAG: GTP 3',8-cyclase MoaA [Candidatus Latescibacteria bacterium]|nr:GTP 3',8-cyclase MoaA [Candidatus Latescibacterota bacterium]
MSSDQLAKSHSRPLLDRRGRPLGSLRVSVIDRCDLRCNYCMPEEEYTWLPTADILTFDEIERLVGVFVGLGAGKVRLTGGEPLLRGRLTELVERLAVLPGLEDLALTTNATQLARFAQPLQRAGLQRVTVSLDSLQPDRFKALTRRDTLDRVLEGIRAGGAAGFAEVKINTVVMRGFNDDELIGLIEFGRQVGAQVRFIEYMDVGGATQWALGRVFSQAEILDRLQAYYGKIEPVGPQGSAPAQRFQLPDGTRFGIIASVSEPFCQACDRSRLTADGMWYLCLYAQGGIDLRQALRQGATSAELEAQIAQVWSGRLDRGAEERSGNADRGALYQVEELQQDPHREMHTRGG